LAQPVCSLTQLTRSTEYGNFSPAINASGTRIAFIGTLTGENPGPIDEIFLVHTTTRAVTQLTHSPGE
jgi:hypothetical protein